MVNWDGDNYWVHIVTANIVENPVDNTATVEYDLSQFLPETPLKISLYDHSGNLISVIMNSIPLSLSDSIVFDASSLITGFYYIVVQYGDGVAFQNFIKQ